MAEFERIEKVSHLRIVTQNIKIRKFMIWCCDRKHMFLPKETHAKAILCGYLRSIAICDPFPLYGNKGLQDYLQLFKISMILTAASSTWKENTIIMGVEHFPFYCSVFGTLDPLIWSHHANYRRGLYTMGGTNLKRQRITEISNRSWNKFQFMCRPLDGFNVSFSVCRIFVLASVLIW